MKRILTLLIFVLFTPQSFTEINQDKSPDHTTPLLPKVKWQYGVRPLYKEITEEYPDKDHCCVPLGLCAVSAGRRPTPLEVQKGIKRCGALYGKGVTLEKGKDALGTNWIKPYGDYSKLIEKFPELKPARVLKIIGKDRDENEVYDFEDNISLPVTVKTGLHMITITELKRGATGKVIAARYFDQFRETVIEGRDEVMTFADTIEFAEGLVKK